jgi:hypothetical protein
MDDGHSAKGDVEKEIQKRLDAASAEVEKILEELFSLAKNACKKPLEKDTVQQWWFAHYRAHFYYAIVHKQKKYKEAKSILQQKATMLGQAAERIAGSGQTVTPLHACLASFEVDCSPRYREDWCN